MNKLSLEYQKKFEANLIFNSSIFANIDPSVKLHDETKDHPLSSSASCLNVIGSLVNDPDGLIKFLKSCGLEIEELYKFSGITSFEGRNYNDKGYAIFEWVGPQESPINEKGGGRGQSRTSVDAFLLGKVNGKTTQILIEWKFTEGLSRNITLGRFCGQKGIERLRRYSLILAELRKNKDFPFNFDEEYRAGRIESILGLHDFSPDHLYQLLRMTLLAKKTTGKVFGEHIFEDYRVVHLTHSHNDHINILRPEYLILSPGLKQFSGQLLHDVWKNILSPIDREKFVGAHWDMSIHTIENQLLRKYLEDRYV